jgi:hypothetical protein
VNARGLNAVRGADGDQGVPGTSLQPAGLVVGRRGRPRGAPLRSAVQRPRAPRGCGQLRGALSGRTARHEPVPDRRAPCLVGRGLHGPHESAGRRRSGRTRPGPKWLTEALTESARAASRTKGTYFAARGDRRHPRRHPDRLLLHRSRPGSVPRARAGLAAPPLLPGAPRTPLAATARSARLQGHPRPGRYRSSAPASRSGRPSACSFAPEPHAQRECEGLYRDF